MTVIVRNIALNIPDFILIINIRKYILKWTLKYFEIIAPGMPNSVMKWIFNVPDMINNQGKNVSTATQSYKSLTNKDSKAK